MSLIILDTDILTLFFQRHEAVRARYQTTGLKAFITIITFHEVMTGRAVSLLKAGDVVQVQQAQIRLRESSQFLEQFEVLWFEEAAFEWVERLRHNKKLSRKMGLKDLLIACIALANDATLVTRNTKDFANIPNLKLDNWAE